jgi:hypothetical protein
MTSRLSLLFASTALTVALALPALAAMQTQGNAQGACSGVCAAVLNSDDLSMPLIRVSGDDDDDDDDGCIGALGNPAPAGTGAPPANGLFGNGAPPVAVTN